MASDDQVGWDGLSWLQGDTCVGGMRATLRFVALTKGYTTV